MAGNSFLTAEWLNEELTRLFVASLAADGDELKNLRERIITLKEVARASEAISRAGIAGERMMAQRVQTAAAKARTVALQTRAIKAVKALEERVAKTDGEGDEMELNDELASQGSGRSDQELHDFLAERLDRLARRVLSQEFPGVPIAIGARGDDQQLGVQSGG